MTDFKATPTSADPLSEAPTGLLLSSAPGERVAGRYSLLGLLGVGGMGSVYRARDEELEEIVALKVLRQDLVNEPGMLERFRREVKLARRVTHKNVARVFDIGEHGADKYLTMEYVEGEPLNVVLARQGALPVARVVEIATAICAGLAAAHAAGVVHRDLKPENVLMAKDGRVVITDFGIARMHEPEGSRTQVGAVIGTPAYMAPEQVQGLADIDTRADIYALGAMLYELFTGEKAWRGESIVSVAAARLVQPPPDPRAKRPDLPTACGTLVLKCMAREREDRYRTAQEVAEDLTSLTMPAMNKLPVTTLVTPAASAPGGGTPPPAAQGLSAEKAVAVLPFRNSGPPDDEYLAEGLTDDLIDMLSMTRGLKLRPRGVVMRWKGVDQDPREIGRELAVQVVVEGSVRRTPAGVRISARVLSVADGFQLWAKRFDRPEKDLFVVNDEVAKAIADALTVDMAQPARESPTDPVAVELYLKARVEYRKFWVQHVREAVKLLEQALARAPQDPTILSGYASALARMSFFNGDNAILAKQAAERALAVAPHLAEAHLAMAHGLFQFGDVAGAVQRARQAILRAPALAEAYGLIGMILSESGPLDEAARVLETARSLDPAAPSVGRNLARVFVLRGDWDGALKLLEQVRTIEGEFAYFAGLTRYAMWFRDEALTKDVAERLRDVKTDAPIQMAIRDALLDKISPFDSPVFQQAMANRDGGWRRSAYFRQVEIELAVYVGDVARAAGSIVPCAQSGLIDLLWMDRCPLVEPIRATPEFLAARVLVDERVSRMLEALRAG
ncbi:protein kinase domain-containing protein [Polyangium jinanense]|uniref:non-specific serine/threonine protein kinase n=1 Tax=Polyangium jinanense TaxID=2829994 RepID=A0A9X4AQL8_9BACT|nr:protein kinase [Polyangium jinanense]MDC3955012.1 protein kinase [Polyangium jinanense]MDC3981218.1 protein kinase [Polyangium jinanense]